MYVNKFTRDYGAIGRAAIRRFLADAHEKNYISLPIEIEFVE
jgi:predicted solute-binding protein